ncbi:MAG: PLP-dependent aminotransferase family protein [Lachnospiraceae bacterium]|jgi:GntR family transcriptional regulator/MocR family aminotransferase|nr:PLP-dependent aminotransferase family protein [Lachnospiraceae bacterium]
MRELTIPIEVNGKEHIYEQIYQYIKKEIIEGSLSEGDRLPSTRALSEHLEVARSTVGLAYDQLLSEGYIESVPYKGYYVCRLEGMLYLEQPETKKEEKKPLRQTVRYDFSPNAVDVSSFPMSVWQKINKEVLSEHYNEILELGDPKGDPGLRRTICQYLHSFRGVKCREEQIIVGAGNDYLLMLLGVILGEGRKLAIENPTYLRAYRIFSSIGYKISAIPLDENGMQVPALRESAADTAYIMPSHQFPTGVIMPIGRRMELLNWANEKEERFLIEDDYDSEFRYRGKPIPSLQSVDKRGRVIYVGTFSKSIAPAIRVSYMVLPQELLERYEKNCSFFSSSVSRIQQNVLAEFIRGGHYERYLNKMRKLYRNKHNQLCRLLEVFEERFEIYGEGAGLHVLLVSKDPLVTEEELVEKANKTGCKVYGLSSYRIEQAIQDWRATVLIGYAGLTEREIEEGVAALKRAWLLEENE